MTSADTHQKSMVASQVLKAVAPKVNGDLVALALIFLGEEEGRPLDVSSLSAALAMPHPTTHRLISRLTETGLIRSSVDTQDRRWRLLYLSKHGKQRAATYIEEIEYRIKSSQRIANANSGLLVTIRKASEVSLSSLRHPALVRFYSWAQKREDSLPLELLDAIYVIQPDFADFKRSLFSHWGANLNSGRTNSHPYTKLSEFISPESKDYLRHAAEALSKSRDKVVAQHIEVDWEGPGRTLQRVLIAHERIGVIGCVRWLD